MTSASVLKQRWRPWQPWCQVLQLYQLDDRIYPRGDHFTKLFFCIQTKNNIKHLYQPFIELYLFYKCINFLIEVGSHFHHKIKYIYVQFFFPKIFIYLNMFNVNNIQYLHTDYLHLTIIYKRFSHVVFFASEILPKKLGSFSCDRNKAVWRQRCQ